MRFVCPEASGAIDSKDAVEMIYRHVFRSTDNPNTERIQTQSSTFLPIMGEIDTKTKSELRLFAPSAVYPFSGRIPLSGTARTIAALATALGISITLTNTDTAAYYWYAENVFGLYSIPYYLTIYTEAGLILAKPKRISTSQNRGKLVDKDCVKRQYNQLNPGYDGEPGFDYTVAADTSIMSPASITNTYKDLCLNKHLAIRNLIYFSIPKTGVNDQGYDALDFVVGPGGYNFIIVSKQDDPDGVYYLYTAVREFDEARSYSGGSVTPVKISLGNIVDEYTHSGAAANSFGITGLDLDTDYMYEWIVDFNAVVVTAGWRIQFNTQTPSGTMTNYAVHTRILINGAETYAATNTENRVLANDSGKPYGFIAQIRQYNSPTANKKYIEMRLEHTRFRTAFSDDRMFHQIMYYRGDLDNLSDLLLSAWTGSKTIIAGFKSLLIKRRI